MKINTKFTKALIASLIVAGTTLYVTSCKKGNTGTTSATVTEADAAELTTDAVSPTTGGMVTQLSSSVTVYNTVIVPCGAQKDSTIIYKSSPGASPSYSYNLNLNYKLTCGGLAPSQLAFNYNGAGSYDGSRLSSTDSSTGGFIVTGLPASSTQYLFNTTYSRNGSTTSKIGNQHTFTSVVQINGSNIAVDKTSKQIVSGTASVTISATSTSGKSFTFNGNISFLGGKKATLVLNSGASYTIQWS